MRKVTASLTFINLWSISYDEFNLVITSCLCLICGRFIYFCISFNFLRTWKFLEKYSFSFRSLDHKKKKTQNTLLLITGPDGLLQYSIITHHGCNFILYVKIYNYLEKNVFQVLCCVSVFILISNYRYEMIWVWYLHQSNEWLQLNSLRLFWMSIH